MKCYRPATLKAEVQERLETPRRQRCPWLRVLLEIVLVYACTIPAVIPTTLRSNPSEAVRLPDALLHWDLTYTSSSTEVLKAFQRGVDCYDNQRYASALEVLPDSQEAKATAVGDYILLYRAKSNLMMERNREALSDFRLLESRYPESPLAGDALVGQCQALLKLNEPKPVLALLNGRKSDGSPEILYYRARALDLAGEKDQALALYLQIHSRYPVSEFSSLSERYLLALSPGALKGKSNYGIRLLRAENLIKANEVRGARALLLALKRVPAPDPASTRKKNLLLAEAEYRLGRASAALGYLRNVTAADPALHARAIYLEGACCRRLDREKALLALRDKALKLFPLSNDTEELCFTAATYFDVNYQPAKAREAYKILYKAFPKGRYAESALWKLALFPYFDRRFGEAALGFRNYLLAYPNPLPASSAIYWMGRCFEKLGDYGKAKYAYSRAQALANDSYYGQLARKAEGYLKRLRSAESVPVSGLDFKEVVVTCDAIQLPPVLLPEPDAAGVRVIERARQLVAAGVPGLALSELRWGSRRYPQNDDALCYIMARIYASTEDFIGAISNLRRAFPDYNNRPAASLPEEVWQLLFPVRHWEIISRQTAGTNLDPTLILGVIRQESAFDQEACSRANARGLMQILPSTGRRLAKQARIVHYSVKELYKPETNIVIGTRYLASFLQKYGRTEPALAAYNAGGTRADRWLKEFGNADMAEFVERIPFSETRNYVKQVLSNKAHYDLLTASAASETR